MSTLNPPSEMSPAAKVDLDPVKLVGLVAEFDDVTAVTEAATKVRDAGYRIWDVHSPFPIHGIDTAMGTKPTILPWLVMAGGLSGCVFGIIMTWAINAVSILPPEPFNWVNLQGYQYLISGKPLWSLPANIPVIFECTVLFSALTAVFGMLLLNKLPMLYNPLFKLKKFRRVTDDRFFLVIDAGDPQFDEGKTLDLLRSTKPLSVETLED